MLCQCGCGQETKLSDRTITKLGRKKGDPLPFLHGHAGGMASRRYKMTPDLWTETDRGYMTLCWMWNGPKKNKWGHCSVWIGGKEFSAHRRSYEQFVGPIPEGLEIDHLCKQPGCVNPEHLEPVTHGENIRRSRLAKLTWEEVREIRESPLSTRKAAKIYGVSQGAISAVRRRKTWAD